MNKIILTIVVISVICSALVYVFRKRIDGVEERIPRITGGANEALYVNGSRRGPMTRVDAGGNTYKIDNVRLNAGDKIKFYEYNGARPVPNYNFRYDSQRARRVRDVNDNDLAERYNIINYSGTYNIKFTVDTRNRYGGTFVITRVGNQQQPQNAVNQQPQQQQPQQQPQNAVNQQPQQQQPQQQPQNAVNQQPQQQQNAVNQQQQQPQNAVNQQPQQEDEPAPQPQNEYDADDIEQPLQQVQAIEPINFDGNSITFINFTPYTFTELAHVNESKPTTETQTQAALNQYASVHHLNIIHINPINVNKPGTLTLNNESQKIVKPNSNLVTRPTKLINAKGETYTGPKSNIVCINSAPSSSQLDSIRNTLTPSGFIVSTTQINNPNLTRIGIHDTSPEARELVATLKTAYIYKLKPVQRV